MVNIILDSLIDSIKLLPFLLVTYLVMEYIEHKTGEKAKSVVKKSGKFGPLLGGILGIFPQCGFSAAAANLYAGKIITLGTLIAIFLSTSDEMLPILISENVPIYLIVKILAIKLILGVTIGFAIDIIIKIYRKTKENINRKKNKLEEVGKIEQEISHICEHEHCNCEEDGIIKSSIKHTINIFLFIVIISLVINTIIYYIGEGKISNLILNMPVVGPLIAGIIGLIPNCAGSVILTQLYLQQVISMGSMIAGLLVGSGIGILILFRVNKNVKENVKILSILYVTGVTCGIFIDLIM